MAQTTIKSFFPGSVAIKQEPGIENENQSQPMVTLVTVKAEPKSPETSFEGTSSNQQVAQPGDHSNDSDATVDYNPFHAIVKTEEKYPDSEVDTDVDEEEDDPMAGNPSVNIKDEPNVDSDTETIPDEQMNDNMDIDEQLANIKTEKPRVDNDIGAIHDRYGSIILDPRYPVPSTSGETAKRKNDQIANNGNATKKSKPNDQSDLFEKVEQDIEQSMKLQNNSQINNEIDKIVGNSKRTSRFCVNNRKFDENENMEELLEVRESLATAIAEEERNDRELAKQTNERIKCPDVDRQEKIQLLQTLNGLEKREKQRQMDKCADELEKQSKEMRTKASQYLQNMLEDFDFDNFDRLTGTEMEPKREDSVKYTDFYAKVVDTADEQPIFDGKSQRFIKTLIKDKSESELPKGLSMSMQIERNKIAKIVEQHLKPYLNKKSINQKMYDIIMKNIINHFQQVNYYGEIIR